MTMEAAGKVVSTTVEAMRSVPLAIALLAVNVAFLGLGAYVLGEVAANSKERNIGQFDLIKQLVTDIRDCRQGPRPQSYDPITKSLIFLK